MTPSADGAQGLDAAPADASLAARDASRLANSSTGTEDDAGPSAAHASAGAGGFPGASGAAAATTSQDAGGASDAAGTPACAADLDPAHPPQRLELSGALQLSDPALIESRELPGTYYAFATGPGISVRTSRDLVAWQDAGRVFAFDPQWIAQTFDAVPALWSPDISFFGGVYHLYYAVSKQGNNRSCIGHATAKALPGPFEDQGAVLCSSIGAQRDDWNAIHPNYVEDENGRAYLAFGSFYSGIKLVALNPSTGKVASNALISIAARMKQGGAIEAPFIVRRCDYFYLFVSFDRCCDGVNSTYKIYLGRSKMLTGPYLDRAGAQMLDGGGTALVIGDETWHGPGHSAILHSGDRWYDVHHAYYASEEAAIYQQGQPYLRISELAWDKDGWPASGGP